MVDIDTDDPEDVLGVPIEATAFLAFVSAFAVLLFVIFVFVNKKYKLVNVGLPSSSSRPSKGLPVPLKQGHDQLLSSAAAKRSSPFRPPLGDSYILSPESSSDSEEDILRRLRQTMSLQRNSIDATRVTVVGRGSPLLTTAVRSVSVDQPSVSSYHHHHPRPALTQQRSFDLSYHPLHLSTPSSNNVNGLPSTSNHLVHQNSNQSSSSYTGMRPLRVSGVAGSRELNEISNNACSNSKRRSKGLMMMGSSIRSRGDLISLAEKGKVNGGSSASSTSSEDDPSRLQGVLLRNHPIRVGQPPRPVSVTSSNATTVMATNNPTPTSQHGHTNNHHVQSAPSSTTGYRRMLPPRTKSIDSESPPPSEQGCSTYGDSLADGDDHIFEVEELSLVEGVLSRGTSSSPVQCGSIEVAFDYEAAPRKMTVHVIQVRGVPPKDVGGANNTQVRLVLLPERKQKHKTKVRSGENPSFMETFIFSKVNPEDVSSLGIRFRLYGCERMRRERLLGEAILGFGSLHLEMETTMWLNFEPRYHLSWESKSESGSLARSDSASSTASIAGGIPELMVGLAYNGTTGRLTVEIIKGSHFRQLAGGRAPDSYVKLVLVSVSGQEIGRAKTSLRRAQSNPLYKETFMFQVALFQLQDVTLLVSVYGRKGVTRRELLGFFAFGNSTGSGDEETQHWEDMCDAQGDQMCRWHVLQT